MKRKSDTKTARKRISLIHWNAAEAKAGLATIKSAGYPVSHLLPRGMPSLKVFAKKKPDAIVIDLSRLPSHGRDVALALRQYKPTRYIPLVFVEGDPKKVDRIKALLPDAVFTRWKNIASPLRKALTHPPLDPVVPRSSLEGYSGTPLVKKLGIKPGSSLGLIDAPDGFEHQLENLPADVKVIRRGGTNFDLALWFVTSANDLQSRIRSIAGLTQKIWIVWPKKTSGIRTDLTQRFIRETGLAVGLVDYKVCSIDSVWSGLQFTWRKQAA